MRRTEWTFNVAVDFWRTKKAVMAGRDGRDLFLCSIAWSTEQETDGYVPTDALDQLAGQVGMSLAAAKKAAVKLTSKGVEFWEEADGGWLIHDYTQWQYTAAERERQRMQNATRQGKHRQSNALLNGQRNGVGTPVINGVLSPQSLREVLHRSSSTELRETEDDEERRNLITTTKALGLLAQRDLVGRQAKRGLEPVGDQGKWLDSAARRRSESHGQQAYDLAVAHPDWTPEQVVEHLDSAAAGSPDNPTPPPCPICEGRHLPGYCALDPTRHSEDPR